MRHKIIYLWPQSFVDLCKSGTKGVQVVKNNLPEDTKYVRCFTDDISGYGKVGIVIESSFFPELKDGEMIPIIEPLFEKV